MNLHEYYTTTPSPLTRGALGARVLFMEPPSTDRFRNRGLDDEIRLSNPMQGVVMDDPHGGPQRVYLSGIVGFAEAFSSGTVRGDPALIQIMEPLWLNIMLHGLEVRPFLDDYVLYESGALVWVALRYSYSSDDEHVYLCTAFFWRRQLGDGLSAHTRGPSTTPLLVAQPGDRLEDRRPDSGDNVNLAAALPQPMPLL